MFESYAALIVDLKNSRSYSHEERNLIQHFIDETIHVLNRIYYDNIVRDVDFSAGDEIQGLFKSSDAAYTYYRMLSMLLHPIKTRAGIGVGSWDVQLENKGTTGQDGRAYHNARFAIENADEIEGYPILIYSESSADMMINTVIGAAASITAKQTVNQNQIMLITELLFPIYSSCTYSLEFNAPHQIQPLLQRKHDLDHRIEEVAKPLPLDHVAPDAIVAISPINALETSEDFSFLITNGKKRGIPTALSKLLGIRRQTIEKTLKAGNIFTARNMAIAAIKDMNYTR